MSELSFTKEEILTMRRALNALVVRQELNSLAASEPVRREIESTLEDLHNLDIKLLQLKPSCSCPAQ
jgi:hypothetical protein